MLELTLVPKSAEGGSRMGGDGLEATKDFPDCIDVRIVRHQDETCRFLFIERWASKSAYKN